MSFEQYLSSKLSRFSFLEYVLVMVVYFFFSLLITSFYTTLERIDWWFYLILVLICAFPLLVHLFSQPGVHFGEKFNSCLKNNNPSLQINLFFAVFFFAQFLIVLFPILAQGAWWIYVILIVIFAILPLRTSWIW